MTTSDGGHFVDNAHALAAGLIFGALLLASDHADPETGFIDRVDATRDERGDYRNRLRVTVSGRDYDVVVVPIEGGTT